jgi:methylmalonyl-CoA carboxyltransferase 12S subunit
MAKVKDLAATLEQLQAQVAEMSRQIAFLEQRNGKAMTVPQAAAPEVLDKPVAAGITEAELMVISAAIGAYLGVRAHIRQIRLIGTAAWAQEGRVSIQASHRLQS